MQRLCFISPLALITEVTVAAVNNGQPLEHNAVYEVSNEVADALLTNEGDWRQLSPPKEKSATSNATEVAAETEGNNE
jgi:hypothetical protein